jgi:hypothetical protein
MPTKTLPNDADLAALLESLKKEDVVESDNDVVSFLSYFNIKPGTNLTSSWFLFKLYKGWSKTPLKRYNFSLELSKYLPRAHQTFLYIDKTSAQISKQLKDYLETNKKSRKHTKNPNYHRKMKTFLDRYQIKEGNYPIEGFILFHMYDCWSYQSRKEKPLTQKIFISLLKVFFEHYEHDDITWFYIDKSILNYISYQVMNELRQGKEFYTHGKKKNNEKTRQKEANKKK